MEKQAQYYYELLTGDRYINPEVMINFLRQGCIADYEMVADIFGKGLSQSDYQDLQEAVDRFETNPEGDYGKDEDNEEL